MLEFIYGTMGAGKSLRLIDTYKSCKRDINGHINILTLRYKLHDNDEGIIKSRNGDEITCRLFDGATNFEELFFYEQWSQKYDLILIDEIQFCSETQINDLYRISCSVDVYCYGLLLDQTGRLFEASKRLIEVSDFSIMLHSNCSVCLSSATTDAMYIKRKDGSWERDKGSHYCIPKPPSKTLQYVPMCRCCFELSKYDVISNADLKVYLNLKRLSYKYKEEKK